MMLLALFRDERGFIISAELILVATILVIGLIVGLTSVQQAVVGELQDVGAAIGSLNQSFAFSGFRSGFGRFGGVGGVGGVGGFGGFGRCTKAWTRGSMFNDVAEVCGMVQASLGPQVSVSSAPIPLPAPVPCPAPVVAPVPTVLCPPMAAPLPVCPPVECPQPLPLAAPDCCPPVAGPAVLNAPFCPPMDCLPSGSPSPAPPSNFLPGPRPW